MRWRSVTQNFGLVFLLDLLNLFENGFREPDTEAAKLIQTQRHVAGSPETAHNLASLSNARALEIEDVLHLDLVAFDSHDLRDAADWFRNRERRFGGLPSLGQLGSHDAETGNGHHVRGDRWLR